MLLKDKIALITGSGKGIGKSIALELTKEGATVFLNDINKEVLMEVQSDISISGSKCFSVVADVSNHQEVKNMFEHIIKEAGTLDILVNNAGINRDKTLHKMSFEEWEEVIKVNLTSVYNCSKEAVKIMREKRYGKIINISSLAALFPKFGQTNYAASKAGIIGFTKSLALETAKRGITVNVIAPGYIKTDMLDTIPDDLKEQFKSTIPMGRFGLPEEIAKVAAFLISDNASYITGQVININGGAFMV